MSDADKMKLNEAASLITYVLYKYNLDQVSFYSEMIANGVEIGTSDGGKLHLDIKVVVCDGPVPEGVA